MKKVAVLSLSGGLDSTSLLLDLLSKKFEVYAFSFNYGQKHNIELEKAKNNVSLLKTKGFEINHSIIDLTDAFSGSGSSLHGGSGVDIPEGHYADENMKSTVIENRNVIFSSIVFGKALVISKALDTKVDIYLGIHAGDHTIYPDCREESRLACELTFKISNWGSEKVSYQAPFINKSKAEVLAEGVSALRNINLLQMSYNKPPLFNEDEERSIWLNTHTCYNPNEKGESCGKCGSCTERLEAFAENNLIDPVKYDNLKV